MKDKSISFNLLFPIGCQENGWNVLLTFCRDEKDFSASTSFQSCKVPVFRCTWENGNLASSVIAVMCFGGKDVWRDQIKGATNQLKSGMKASKTCWRWITSNGKWPKTHRLQWEIIRFRVNSWFPSSHNCWYHLISQREFFQVNRKKILMSDPCLECLPPLPHQEGDKLSLPPTAVSATFLQLFFVFPRGLFLLPSPWKFSTLVTGLVTSQPRPEEQQEFNLASQLFTGSLKLFSHWVKKAKAKVFTKEAACWGCVVRRRKVQGSFLRHLSVILERIWYPQTVSSGTTFGRTHFLWIFAHLQQELVDCWQSVLCSHLIGEVLTFWASFWNWLANRL